MAAGLLALWFAIAVPGSGSMQMPDGIEMDMVGMSMMHGAAHDLTAQCAHRDPAQVGAETPRGSLPTKHREHGQCDGVCCAPAMVTLMAGRLVFIPAAPARAVAETPVFSGDAAPPIAPQVQLPPPLGPPVVGV